jgi:hypothetical protein
VTIAIRGVVCAPTTADFSAALRNGKMRDIRLDGMLGRTADFSAALRNGKTKGRRDGKTKGMRKEKKKGCEMEREKGDTHFESALEACVFV